MAQKFLIRFSQKGAVFMGQRLLLFPMENRTINVDKQLQRDTTGRRYIVSTKTKAGARMLPMTEEVYQCFAEILRRRKPPRAETMIDGHGNFLYYDKNGNPLVAMH